MIRALINKKEIDEAYAVFSQSVTNEALPQTD